MKRSVLILSGVLSISMANSAIADSVMPAPKVTQFKAESGTAPVASGQSDAVNNLPPVSDVNSATTKAVVTPPVTVTANVSSDANASPVIDTSGETVHAQLRIIQNQVNSLMRRNSAENMAALQVQLQKINGKLAEEQNNLVNLQKKQNSFYANLDQRIGVLEQMGNKSGNSTAAATVKPQQPQQPTSPVSAVSPKPSAPVASDAQTYQAAVALVDENKYVQAQTALQSYINDFPQGKFQWDARYWSGEIYFLRKNYSQAEKMFNLVVKNGTDKSRLSICQLRLAKIYLSTNREALAKKILFKVKSTYPNTTEARLASIYLKEIQA
jgi:tol-pal system protein YbgF